MISRVVDSKGRLNLGQRFANATVLLDEAEDGTITLKRALTIPVDEVWLFENQAALNSVLTGIHEAREGKFSQSPPDLDAAASWVEDLQD